MGFEPTYEELKRNISICYYLNKLSFEPTYEELKRSSAAFCSNFSNTFWAYLWGIETTNSCIIIKK